MKQQISLEQFKRELLECLEETFEQHHGVYLDKGTSLLPTLGGISAEEASRAVAENGATIAAHVEHTRLYLDVLGEMMRTQTVVKTNCARFGKPCARYRPKSGKRPSKGLPKATGEQSKQ